MSSAESCNISFAPFTPEDLETKWRIRFGVWRVKEGKLCHVLPELDDDSVESVISGAPGMEQLNSNGWVELALPARGADRVRLTLNVSARKEEGLSIALDEWALDWRLSDNLQAFLSHCDNATSKLDYDSDAVLEAGATNQVEILGEPERVRFRVNGRELFEARRKLAQPYRRINVSSQCGVELSDVRVECQGVRPAREPKRRLAKPLLSATVDFGDDIIEAPYTADMIRILMERLADLGIRRVYWLHSHRIRPEALGPGADPSLAKAIGFAAWSREVDKIVANNGLQTVENCYPYLPKVCAFAHDVGMQVYSVHKLFDLGFFPSRGIPSPYVKDHFQNEHPDALFQRHAGTGDQARADAPVRAIRIYKDNARGHAVRPEDLSVWVSDDHETYTPLPEPARIALGTERRRFPIHWEGGETEEREVQVITVDDVDIRTKYFALVYQGPRGSTFRNRLYRLAEAFDAEGRPVPTTRNLPGQPKAAADPWLGQTPFIFKGFADGNCPSGCWMGPDRAEQFEALDDDDVGIAFVRGHDPHMRGMPNPAHPAARAFWMDWIQDALDAGVDGVELRISNHNNLSDWANYGFGPILETEFKKRTGRDLKPDASCRREHMELLGEFYSDFLRAASEKVRAAGKKFQHHVWRSMDSAPDERAMDNIRWNWRQWMEDGLLDAITLKSLHPSSNIFDAIMDTADAHDVETIFCPYLNCLLSASDSWEQQMGDLLGVVIDRGLHGINLYETASFMRAKKEGDVVLAFPELKDILAQYR